MRLLSTASVMERFDVKSKETIRQMVKAQIIPPPIKTKNGGGNFWLESEVNDCIESLAAKRNGAQPQQAAA